MRGIFVHASSWAINACVWAIVSSVRAAVSLISDRAQNTRRSYANRASLACLTEISTSAKHGCRIRGAGALIARGPAGPWKLATALPARDDWILWAALPSRATARTIHQTGGPTRRVTPKAAYTMSQNTKRTTHHRERMARTMRP